MHEANNEQSKTVQFVLVEEDVLQTMSATIQYSYVVPT